ncbi:hypothetical protein ACFV4N_11200 [Actinosynnema sp. NPDC059797]
MTSGLSRYVRSAGAPVLLGDDGFLLLPSDPRWLADAPDREKDLGPPSLVTDPGVLSGRFVLLAAGGAGKTETCKALAGFEGAEYVNAAPLTREDLWIRIAAVVDRGTTAYLDGLDQAASRDPMLLQWLAEELSFGAAASVSWRLACRAVARESALTAAGFDELTLLPLDRASAEALVDEKGYDGPAFIHALVEAGRGGLSACIGQLLAEARFWHDKGALPEQSQDALAYEIALLLQEANKGRRPTMPHDRVTRLAKRLGAFAAFSGVQRLTPAVSTDKGTLSADRLPSTPEPDEFRLFVEPDNYRDVMATGLFEAGPEGTVVSATSAMSSTSPPRTWSNGTSQPVSCQRCSACASPGCYPLHASGSPPGSPHSRPIWLCR